MQQSYDLFKGIQLIFQYAFQYFPNKNHESFEILSKIIYHCFQADYLKPRLKPINLDTNIKIISLSCYQVSQPIQAQFINLEVAQKKKRRRRKKITNILTYIKVSTFYSVSNCQWQPHTKALFWKHIRKKFVSTFFNRKQLTQLIGTQFIKHINSLLRNGSLCIV